LIALCTSIPAFADQRAVKAGMLFGYTAFVTAASCNWLVARAFLDVMNKFQL